MNKMVHLWEVRCKSCGTEFEHVFRASDVFKPHIFNELRMKCPKCGEYAFDPIRFNGKMTEQEWIQTHPDLNINDLPDHSYLEK